MAAGRLPAPGKIVNGEMIGPCLDENCGHEDCEETRLMVAMECPYCGKVIGYEVRIYAIGDQRDQLVHAKCHEEAIKR